MQALALRLCPYPSLAKRRKLTNAVYLAVCVGHVTGTESEMATCIPARAPGQRAPRHLYQQPANPGPPSWTVVVVIIIALQELPGQQAQGNRWRLPYLLHRARCRPRPDSMVQGRLWAEYPQGVLPHVGDGQGADEGDMSILPRPVADRGSQRGRSKEHSEREEQERGGIR